MDDAEEKAERFMIREILAAIHAAATMHFPELGVITIIVRREKDKTGVAMANMPGDAVMINLQRLLDKMKEKNGFEEFTNYPTIDPSDTIH